MVKNNLSLFSFTRRQRKGIFALVFVIVLLQFMHWFVDFTPVNQNNLTKNKWLSLQDTLMVLNSEKESLSKIFPFNPNFISDFKGYKLGLSVQQIDKLHAFRSENKFVNSAAEFQRVTGISDSLLNVLSPLFKFPEWVNNKKNKKSFEKFAKAKSVLVKKDINLATAEDLIKIYGIGDVIAKRILAHRNSLGGFVSLEQLQDIWGLKPEVIKELENNFILTKMPSLTLIDINNASQKELMQFFYFKYSLAKQILIYRSMNGDIKNIDDLIDIKGFPVEKAKIIALYLKF